MLTFGVQRSVDSGICAFALETRFVSGNTHDGELDDVAKMSAAHVSLIVADEHARVVRARLRCMPFQPKNSASCG